MNLYLRQDFHDTGPHLVKKVKRAAFGEARLGFVLTVLFICGLFPMAVYTSVLMSRTRTILENLGVKEPLGTMGQAGAPCAGLIRDMDGYGARVLPSWSVTLQGDDVSRMLRFRMWCRLQQQHFSLNELVVSYLGFVFCSSALRGVVQKMKNSLVDSGIIMMYI